MLISKKGGMIWERRIHFSIKVQLLGIMLSWQAVLPPRNANREVVVRLSVCLLLLFLCHSLMHSDAIEELIHLQMVCDELKAATLKFNPETCNVFHKG